MCKYIAEAKANIVTTEQRKLALDTVRDILLRVDELMRNDAKLAPIRIQIIHRLLDDVDRIREDVARLAPGATFVDDLRKQQTRHDDLAAQGMALLLDTIDVTAP